MFAAPQMAKSLLAAHPENNRPGTPFCPANRNRSVIGYIPCGWKNGQGAQMPNEVAATKYERC